MDGWQDTVSSGSRRNSGRFQVHASARRAWEKEQEKKNREKERDDSPAHSGARVAVWTSVGNVWPCFNVY